MFSLERHAAPTEENRRHLEKQDENETTRRRRICGKDAAQPMALFNTSQPSDRPTGGGQTDRATTETEEDGATERRYSDFPQGQNATLAFLNIY